jgi:hypothetical protein
VHEAGLKVAAASSAKKSELEVYLDIACIKDLVDVATSSEDAAQSEPAPDIFQVALKKLGIEGAEAVAIGDTPYDAEAARKAGIPTIGMLCGGFTEADLRKGGCVAVYPGPGALLACFGASPLALSDVTRAQVVLARCQPTRVRPEASRAGIVGSGWRSEIATGRGLRGREWARPPAGVRAWPAPWMLDHRLRVRVDMRRVQR